MARTDRRRRFAPHMETLEGREVPAVTAQFAAGTGVLTVNGDDLANTITVGRTQDGVLTINGGTVSVAGQTPRIGTVTRIQVFGLGGDDKIALDEINGPLPGASLVGGLGSDTLLGGVGRDQIFGDAGDDTVDAGRGDDRVFLGAGNDQFNWDPGEGSDVVDGDAGFDVMAFNGSGADETFKLGAVKTRLRLTRDVGAISMSVGTVERVTVAAVGGADTITLNDLAGTGVQDVRAELEAVKGGGAADDKTDRVILNGTAQDDFVDTLATGGNLFVLGLPTFVTVAHAAAADELAVNTLGGNDRVSASGVAEGVIRFTADGGAGNDNLSGTNGPDTLVGGAGNDFADGQRGNDVVLMGDGADIFSWSADDGSDVIEGGAGADAMTVSGSAANEVVTMSAIGARFRLTRDVDAAALDANDVESASFFSFGGADRVVLNDLGGTDVKRVDLSLFDFGVPGGNADTVVVNGTNGADTVRAASANGTVTVTGLAAEVRITGTEAAGDRLEVNSLGGADTIDSTGLEAAEMRFLGNGGAGDDVLLGGAGDDVFAGGEDVVSG
ncbi:MAG TPA: calcium-binding protein, partial [Gemmataceae bacterium]|nr:calcium-binding protein [Gemmataceae bacterium]